MFDHVTIRVTDRDASRRFYDTVLATLDIRPAESDAEAARREDFAIAPAGEGAPDTRRLHIAFVARSRAQVDAFWHAGYAASVLDPDANMIEIISRNAG